MTQAVSRRKFLRNSCIGAGGLAMTACASPPEPQAQSTATTSASSAAQSAGPSTATPLLTPGTAPTPATAGSSFPDDFLWGVATSAYQIEGAAQEDGRGESVWDRFSHTPGRTKNGDTGDVANDHYHRYAQDLDLMQSLGVKTYRFSIAWPRILPVGSGAVNQAGLDFYQRLVEGLLERNIRPMATLFHWDLPQALQDKGGWENRDTAQRFAEYADVTFRALSDRVPLWLTLNEPKTVVAVGYTYGIHAPGIKNRGKAYEALHHMLLGHGLATQAFRAIGTDSQIGLALNLMPVYAAPGAQQAEQAVKTLDGWENRVYLDPVLRGDYPDDIRPLLEREVPASLIQPEDAKIIGTPIDILGVNYYHPLYVKANGDVVNGPHPLSAASWQQIFPDGLHDMLLRIKTDYGDIPLYITENGAPFDDQLGADNTVNDKARVKFLHDHMNAAQRAIAAGVQLKGYYVWSLMDNFEWAEGYSQRWGIVYVDFESQTRYPKRSALWYRDVIRANGVGELPADIGDPYSS